MGKWTITAKLSNNDPKDIYSLSKQIYVEVLENDSYIQEHPFKEENIDCTNEVVDGELVQCTTTEPTGDFVETEIQ